MKNFRTLIIGKTGTGKTTFGFKLFKKLHTKKRISLCWDTLGVMKKRKFFKNEYYDVKKIKKIVSKCYFVPYSEEEEINFLNFILKKIFKDHIPFLIFFDEIDKLCQNYPKEMYKLFHFARNFDTSLIGTVRKFTTIHRKFISQTSDWYIFKITDSRDLEYLEREVGDIDIEKVKKLKIGQKIHILF